MRMHSRSLAVVIGACFVVLSGCGAGDSDTPSPSPAPAWSQGVVPTADQLESVLLTSDDLGGADWTKSLGSPGDLWFCPEASTESSSAAADVTWQASVQFVTGQDVASATATKDPPVTVTVVEWLLADEPSQIEQTFTALREGAEACYGPDTVDGRAVVTAPMGVPAVGDDRFGESDTYLMGEPGNPDSTFLRGAIVRDGPVLMLVSITENAPDEGFQPQLTQDYVDTIITTAAANLP